MLTRWMAVALAAGVTAGSSAVSGAAPGELSASVRAGVANPSVRGVAVGPGVAAQGAVGITDRMSIVAGLGTSRHSVEARTGGGILTLSQIALGGALALDLTPLVPSLHLGAAGVAEGYRGRTAMRLWPYLGLEVFARVRGPLTAGVALRYFLVDGGDASGLDYAQLFVGVGIAR